MKPFTPCRGKHLCQDNGSRCLVCNRDSEEIAETRRLIDALATLALSQEYDNVQEFAAYVAAKLEKKVRHRRGALGTD